MSCFDQQDLLPRKPEEVFDPEIARLKRIIALKDAELNAFREIMPGLKFYPKYGILMYEDQVTFED